MSEEKVMNIKMFHEKLKEIHRKYDEAILQKLTYEEELAVKKGELSQKIIKSNFEAKRLRIEKSKLVAEYNAQKRSPAEVKRLRNQFQRKKENLMKDKDRKCHYCPEVEDLTAHHLISIVDGGDNSLKNLVWACRKCHDGEEGRLGNQNGDTK